MDRLYIMSADMIAAAIKGFAPQGNQDPPQNPRQGNGVATEKSRICSKCGKTITWIPKNAHNIPDNKILCKECNEERMAKRVPRDQPPVHTNERTQAQAPPAANADQLVLLSTVREVLTFFRLPGSLIDAIVTTLQARSQAHHPHK